MQSEEYYLIDFSFSPPLAIERGNFEDCQKTLEEVAAVDGYSQYKILSTEGYKKLKGE